MTYAGASFSIADSAARTGTIVVPDPATITDVTVTFTGLTHTWIGDLIVTLTHVDTATTVDLFRRVG